jgi:hypothetical protein
MNVVIVLLLCTKFHSHNAVLIVLRNNDTLNIFQVRRKSFTTNQELPHEKRKGQVRFVFAYLLPTP